MVMNLEQLRSFLMVAHTGHFTKAATQLHVAQPTLSRQISTLESELGSELFHRARGNITLTAAGETLLPSAKRMLADAEHIRQQMHELSGLRAGRVRLGAPPSLCISLVAQMLVGYHRAYPGIELHLYEAGSLDLLQELAGGGLDLALVVASEHEPNSFDSLTHLPLLGEELVVVSAPGTHLAPGIQELSLAELAALPQIAFSTSYDLRAATMAAYRQLDLQPHIVLQGAQMDAALRFVESGLGVALVPAMVLLDRPELQICRLSSPALTRTIALAHRRDVALSRAAAAMQELITDTAKQLASQNHALSALQSSE